ncbi:MAG TPA: hypothetical protein VGB13_11215 [Candidatus Krumholzibacteria bacterium]|jgi:hypothetical protein
MMNAVVEPVVGAVRGDVALASKLTSELGVQTRYPAPGIQEYFQAVIDGLSPWLSAAITRLGLPDQITLESLTYLILALALAVAAVALWRLFRAVRHSPGRPPQAVGTIVAIPAAPDITDWSEELERLLRAGDARRALEALWWWLSSTLGAVDADSSWTLRELLTHTGRRDLTKTVSALERLSYGPERPEPVALRELVIHLRGLLA